MTHYIDENGTVYEAEKPQLNKTQLTDRVELVQEIDGTTETPNENGEIVVTHTYKTVEIRTPRFDNSKHREATAEEIEAYEANKAQGAEKEDKKQEIDNLRVELSKSDYKIIRQFEQETLTDEEFEALKAERQSLRDKINELENAN